MKFWLRYLLISFLCIFSTNADAQFLNEDSLQYFKELMQGSVLEDDYHSIAEYSGLIGFEYHLKKDFDSALKYYDITLQQAYKLKDTTMIAGTLLNSGIIYKNQWNLELARKSFNQASTFFQYMYDQKGQIEDLESLASCFNSMGNLFQQVGFVNLAFRYYNRAMALHQTTNNQADIAASYNNFGELFLESKLYDSALYYLFTSLRMKNKLPDKSRSANTLLNIAKIYLHKKDTVKAESYLYNLINNPVFKRNKPEYTNAQIEQAKLEFSRKKYSNALALLSAALPYAQAQDLKSVLVIIYDVFRKIYREQNQFQLALNYDNLYINIKELVQDRYQNESLAKLEFIYQIEKSNQKILLLNNEKKSANLKILALASAIGFFLILMLLVIYYLIREKRNKKKMEVLMRELNHRVKNNLQTIKSLLSVQQAKIENPDIKQVVREIENRVQAMIRMHSKLYLDSNITVINLRNYIKDIIQDLEYSYKMEIQKPIDKLDLDDISIEIDKAIPLGLIINEIVSNSYKHVFTKNPDGILTINLKKMQDEKIHLLISDNGENEFSFDGKREASFGLKLINILSRQIRAKLTFTYNSGAAYLIEFDK